MAHMSGNDECPSGGFCDSSELNNGILDSGAMCHMTPQVSDFIPGSLEDTDKHIEVADKHHVSAKQEGQIGIKICNNNGDPFIATLHNIILAPNVCGMLFSIIMSIHLGHTCLFHKGFCTVYFGAKEKNIVTLPHSAQWETCIFGKNQGNIKDKEITSQEENCSRIIASNIRSHIHHIIVGWGY